TPLLHTVDELTMSGIEHGFPEAGFLFLLRLERIEECLVLTRGVDATLDPQLLHGLDETEAGRSDSDGTDQTGLVGIYFIGRTGDVVGTGSTQITDHRVDLGLRMLAAQATNLVIDITGLHRAAARTVDAQDHTLGIGIFKSRTQATHHLVGTGLLAISDHAEIGRASW